MRTITAPRPAVKPRRKPFGAGLGERCPVHTAPVSLDDMAFWEAENARQDELMIDRMYREFQAQERLERGLDA